MRRDYDAEEVDVLAAYCGEIGSAYLFPIGDFEGRSAIQLRLEPSRNNQRLRVNWAEDFDFEARLMALLGP